MHILVIVINVNVHVCKSLYLSTVVRRGCAHTCSCQQVSGSGVHLILTFNKFDVRLCISLQRSGMLKFRCVNHSVVISFDLGGGDVISEQPCGRGQNKVSQYQKVRRQVGRPLPSVEGSFTLNYYVIIKNTKSNTPPCELTFLYSRATHD